MISAEGQAPSGVLGRGFEHFQEERLGEVEAAARGEEQAAGRENPHRAKVDVLVSADRRGEGGFVFRERRRVEHDGVEVRAVALAGFEIVKGVGLEELDVGEGVELAVGACPLQRRRGAIEGDDVLSAAREVERKGAVIAKAVECATFGEGADAHAVFALIEEGAGFLPVPGGGGVAYAMFEYFNGAGDIAGEEFDGTREALLFAKGDVVTGEDALRVEEVL